LGDKKSLSNNNQIINEIDGFIVNYGPENCYVGITANVTTRFRQHGLIPADGVNPRDPRIAWLHRDAVTEQNARDIEQFLVNRYRNRIRGNPGGGINPHNVYVYTIVPEVTNENV